MGTVIIKNKMVVCSETRVTEALNDSDTYERIFRSLFITDNKNNRISLPVVTTISCYGYAIVK